MLDMTRGKMTDRERNRRREVRKRLEKVRPLDAMPLALQAKIGSILVHVEEARSPTGHSFDWEAVESLMADPDIITWMGDMRRGGFLPVKR